MNLQHDFRYASAADTASLTGDEGHRGREGDFVEKLEVSKDGLVANNLVVIGTFYSRYTVF